MKPGVAAVCTVQTFGEASEHDEQLYNDLIQESVGTAGFTKDSVRGISSSSTKEQTITNGLFLSGGHNELVCVCDSHKQVCFVFFLLVSFIVRGCHVSPDP